MDIVGGANVYSGWYQWVRWVVPKYMVGGANGMAGGTNGVW